MDDIRHLLFQEWPRPPEPTEAAVRALVAIDASTDIQATNAYAHPSKLLEELIDALGWARIDQLGRLKLTKEGRRFVDRHAQGWLAARTNRD